MGFLGGGTAGLAPHPVERVEAAGRLLHAEEIIAKTRFITQLPW